MSTSARLFVLLSLLAASAHAISDNAGTSNGDFLKIATDARGAALGPAMVSMVEGADAMRWNPAALGKIETKELSATQIQYYQGVSIENLSFAYPLGNSALAANAFYLSPGTLEGRDTSGAPSGNFDFYDLAGAIGYGRQIQSKDDGIEIDVGGALKIVQEKIAETSYQNPALDAGLIVVPMENLSTGLAIRNLSAHKADFPKEITGGASYTFMRTIAGGIALRYSDDAPLRFGAGAEYRFLAEGTMAALRLGYQTHDALDDSVDSKIPALRSGSLSGLTMGAGMDYHPPMFKALRLQLDYGMAPFGALGISHTVTLKVRW